MISECHEESLKRLAEEKESLPDMRFQLPRKESRRRTLLGNPSPEEDDSWDDMLPSTRAIAVA